MTGEHLRTARILPWILLILHTLAVIAMAVFVHSRLALSDEVIMAWSLFMLVDFPLGWLMIPLESWIAPVAYRYFGVFGDGVLLPAVGFLVLGGAQYFFVGRLAVWYLSLRSRKPGTVP